MIRFWTLVLCFVAVTAVAQERPAAPSDYRQTAAVLAHYPAVADMHLDSPAFRTAEPSLTSQEAMVAFLADLARGSQKAKLGSIGRSTQGRDIPIVYLTAEGLADPGAIRRLGRPVIWLIGQQHVVIVPRANVDGAAADKRVLASGADPNRDHLLLSQPEVRALHEAMRALPPDVVFDHHEFSVAWRWVEKFKGLQGSDVMILEATNPSIPRALTEIARGLYRPALEAGIKQAGLSSFDYVTTDAGMTDRRVSLGGTAPGIARNTFGLRGAVSYLIETRGVGIGLQSYQRRVSTHYLLAKAVLEVSAADPEGLRRRLAEARAAAARSTCR